MTDKIKCEDCYRLRSDKTGRKFCLGWDDPFYIYERKGLERCPNFISEEHKTEPNIDDLHNMAEAGLKGVEAGKLLEKIVKILSPDLTKREHFVFEFAKILLEKEPMNYKLSAGCAVEFADELIKALNEEREDG